MAATAQDPGELFDLYAEDGTPLGRSKPRALVHRDGDWHKSVHIWVAIPAGDGYDLLFQRRSRAKDTWPGALDVAVTGHLRAGEAVVDALREAREEIGIDLGPADVVRIGRRWRVDDRVPGILDREIQDIFLARVPISISAFHPDPAEVDGLVALPLEAAGALFRGEIAEVDGVSFADFVVATDGYYARAHASVAAILAGSTVHAWEIPPASAG